MRSILNLSFPRYILIRLLTLNFLIFALIPENYGQRSGIMQKLRFGFGAGVNFSMLNASGNYELYEDLSGNITTNTYSPLFKNFGNQYYFQAEYHVAPLIVGIRPGTYSYNFSRKNTLVFEESEVSQSNEFSLRYFAIPLELKYVLQTNTIQPFIGGTFMWGTLPGSGKDLSLEFIKNRLSTGITGGGYYDAGLMTFLLSFGYNHGLHIITRKDNRYNTSIAEPYSQSDLKLNDVYINLSILFSLDKKRLSSNTKCVYPYK